MPYTSLKQVTPKIRDLFQSFQGMVLKRADIIENGLLFIYENDQERVVVQIMPTVYTQGKNIVDPINDLTLMLEVRRQPVTAGLDESAEQVGSVELAFSTWLGEDFL